MTTKITIEVPEHAEYRVAIETNIVPTRGNSIQYLVAGERTEVYIHDGLRIVGISEVPVA